MYTNKLKVTIIGAISTGKTTIALRLAYDGFHNTDSTIGASFFTYVHDNIKYEIWDTAGGERFSPLLPIYYRGSDIILMVFDLNDTDTLDKLEEILKKIEQNVHTKHKIIIIGNKNDLVSSEKTIQLNMLVTEQLNNHNIDDYVYISSLTGNGFDYFKNVLHRNGMEMLQYKDANKNDTDIVNFIHDDNNDTCLC